jgi:hypothetical protein
MLPHREPFSSIAEIVLWCGTSARMKAHFTYLIPALFNDSADAAHACGTTKENNHDT